MDWLIFLVFIGVMVARAFGAAVKKQRQVEERRRAIEAGKDRGVLGSPAKADSAAGMQMELPRPAPGQPRRDFGGGLPDPLFPWEVEDTWVPPGEKAPAAPPYLPAEGEGPGHLPIEDWPERSFEGQMEQEWPEPIRLPGAGGPEAMEGRIRPDLAFESGEGQVLLDEKRFEGQREETEVPQTVYPLPEGQRIRSPLPVSNLPGWLQPTTGLPPAMAAIVLAEILGPPRSRKRYRWNW